jgi:hypothetical protein
MSVLKTASNLLFFAFFGNRLVLAFPGFNVAGDDFSACCRQKKGLHKQPK